MAGRQGLIAVVTGGGNSIECTDLVRGRCCRSAHRGSRYHGRYRVGAQNLKRSRLLSPPRRQMVRFWSEGAGAASRMDCRTLPRFTSQNGRTCWLHYFKASYYGASPCELLNSDTHDRLNHLHARRTHPYKAMICRAMKDSSSLGMQY